MTGISVASQAIVYVCLACFTIGTFFFTYYLIPETAMKPIEENLEAILGRNYNKKSSKEEQDEIE